MKKKVEKSQWIGKQRSVENTKHHSSMVGVGIETFTMNPKCIVMTRNIKITHSEWKQVQ